MPLRLAAKSVERVLDRIIGLGLVGEILEFFRAFGPLYGGFRERAAEVRALLRDRETLFLLVSGPGSDRIPDTLFFARKLREAGHPLGPLVVNQVHPRVGAMHPAGASEGLELFRFLGERDHRGLVELRGLLGPPDRLAAMPLEPAPPTNLASLGILGRTLLEQLS
jgi:anion-transporting  ArsA/GET3 family ATPase